MLAEKNLVSSCLSETISGEQILDTSQPIFSSPTYCVISEFHLKLVELDREGNRRSKQALDNIRSVIRNWMAIHGLDPLGPVGDELGLRFNKFLAEYVSTLEEEGLAKQTISDRKCILRKLRESFLEFKRTDGLPQEFPRALGHLIKLTGISVGKLSSKSGVSEQAIRNWMAGRSNPRSSSLPLIRKLEKVLKVPEGTLSSRLPEFIWVKVRNRTCTTAWRSSLSEMLKLRYRLLSFPDRLQDEWDELLLFFTNDQWVREHRLKRNSEWRIRWNNGRCVTGDFHFDQLRSFFGYLCLLTTSQDKRMVGLGFSPEALTLGLLSDADLIFKYLYFMKGRSGAFNSGTLNFLAFCSALLRKKTGYLMQRPEFGALLAEPIAAGDWSPWCKANYKKIRKFLQKIKKGKKDGVRMTRNPFEPVIEIVKERQHPLTVLFELAEKLESLTTLLEKGSKQRLAIHWRSIFHLNLISSNPLRIENFSMMTFIPKDHASFERACDTYRRCSKNKQQLDFAKLYVETSPESNLYQQRDGSWHLRFNERDFKNEKGEDIEEGVKSAPYDVPVVPSVWPSLAEYLFRHRTVLNESLRDTLRRTRAARDLLPVTSEEELLIMRCPYVFRPSPDGIGRVGNDKLRKGYGTSQMPPNTLSTQILILTSKYLSGCKGFSAHACRHLVATEYIKNHPNRYEEAAIALHNSSDMVRKHYSWVAISDLIKPWSNYYATLKEKYDKGEI